MSLHRHYSPRPLFDFQVVLSILLSETLRLIIFSPISEAAGISSQLWPLSRSGFGLAIRDAAHFFPSDPNHELRFDIPIRSASDEWVRMYSLIIFPRSWTWWWWKDHEECIEGLYRASGHKYGHV